MTADHIRELARRCGFELAGVAAAVPAEDRARYHEWVAAGHAGKMGYLTDRRAAVRDDPRNLLPSARSVICVGKLYQTPWPHSTRFHDAECAWISRYAWGEDYHDVMRRGLERLDGLLREGAGAAFESRICVDTAPLLERSLRAAGGARLDRAEYLPDQSAAGLVVLPGRVAGVARDRAGRAAAGPLRHLHALRGGVSHGGDRARAGAGCHAVHLVFHDRAARRNSRGAARRDRGARVRVRHLPGRVPLERARAGDGRSGLRAAPVRAAPGGTGGDSARRSSAPCSAVRR